jgi:hypothetical protein
MQQQQAFSLSRIMCYIAIAMEDPWNYVLPVLLTFVLLCRDSTRVP